MVDTVKSNFKVQNVQQKNFIHIYKAYALNFIDIAICWNL